MNDMAPAGGINAAMALGLGVWMLLAAIVWAVR
jgi:hypothetical protein